MRKISDLSFVFIFLFAVTFATILMSTNIETVETDTITLSETSEQKILQKIFPSFCLSSSSLDESWSCENLYDGDSTTWQDNSIGCKDGWIEFTFNREVYLEFIIFQNAEDTEYYSRNYKAKDILISNRDIGFNINKQLEDNNLSQWIDINAMTSDLYIDILSAYPSQEINGKAPYDECVIQEITFYGRDV